MDVNTKSVQKEERVSTCFDWIPGCFGRRNKWMNNKVSHADDQNDGGVKKEFRDLVDEIQTRLSKLETSVQLLLTKWKEAENQLQLATANQDKIEKLSEQFMDMKQKNEDLKIQLEKLNVTSVPKIEQTAVESGPKTTETVREKKTVRFSEHVDVAYADSYDRKIDKPWTRRTFKEKLAIHKQLRKFKRREMKVHPSNSAVN